MKMMIVRVLLLLVAGYGLICVMLWLFQARFIYFPGRPHDAIPRDVGLAFEEVWLTTEGGRKLHAWWVPGEKSRGAVVFCHGNAGTIGHRLTTLAILHRLGLDTLIFDYQGYGRSEGSPGEQALYADADAAWRYLTETRGIPPERVLAWGRSLGGAVAVELASRRRVAGLVVESSFTSVPDMAKGTFPIPLPIEFLCTHRFDSAARVPKITCPKLFLHSPDDEIVPYRLGRRLYEAAAEPKTFIEISGDHNEGYAESGEGYVGAIRTFVGEALGR